MMLGLAGPAATAAGQTLPRTPLAYTVFGLEGVRLGSHTRIQGDVGTNEGDITLRYGVRVQGGVGGHTLLLRRGSRTGAIFCVQVRGGRKDCQRLPDPVVDGTNIPVVQVTPGSESVTLPPHARRVPLEPGRWRDLRIGARSQLLLAGGVYSVRSITIARGGRLSCLAPCRIDVRRTVSAGRRARIELVAGVEGDGTLSVQGGGGRGAFVAGPQARITGAIYAPTGSVLVGARARVTGSLVGRTVGVGPRSRLARSDG